MIEGLHHVDSLLWVQGEHLAQEVDGLVCSAGRERVQASDGGGLEASRDDMTLGGLAGELHFIDRWSSKEISDELKLLNWALGLEEYPAAEQLAKDAAHTPHVDSGGVMFGAHQDLGRPVVLRHHLLSHVFATVLFLDPGEAEVTNLEHAVRIDEEIPRLDVAMNDFGRVQVLDAA